MQTIKYSLRENDIDYFEHCGLNELGSLQIKELEAGDHLWTQKITISSKVLRLKNDL